MKINFVLVLLILLFTFVCSQEGQDGIDSGNTLPTSGPDTREGELDDGDDDDDGSENPGNTCVNEGEVCTCKIVTEITETDSMTCEGTFTSYKLETSIVSLDLSRFDLEEKSVEITKGGDEVGTFESPDLILSESKTLATPSTITLQSFTVVELQLKSAFTLAASEAYLIDKSSQQISLNDCSNNLIGISQNVFTLTEECQEVVKTAQFTLNGQTFTRYMKGKRADTCERKDTSYAQLDCHKLTQSEIFLVTTLVGDLVGTWKGVKITVTGDKLEHEFQKQFSVGEFVIGNSEFDLRAGGNTITLGKMTINPSVNNFLGSGVTVTNVIKNPETTSDSTILFVSEGKETFQDENKNKFYSFLLCDKTDSTKIYRITSNSNENMCTMNEQNEFVENDCKQRVVAECSTGMILSFNPIPAEITNTMNVLKYETIDTNGFDENTAYTISDFTLDSFEFSVPKIKILDCSIDYYSVKEEVSLSEVVIMSTKTTGVSFQQETFNGFFYSNIAFEGLDTIAVSDQMSKCWYRGEMKHTATVKSVGEKITFEEFGVDDYVTDFSHYTLVIPASMNSFDLTDCTNSYSFASMELNHKVTIIDQTGMLTIKSVSFGENVEEIDMNINKVETITIDNENIKGKIFLKDTTECELTLPYSSSSVDLFTTNNVKIEDETISKAIVGEDKLWYNTMENTCTLTDSQFGDTDYCGMFDSYLNVIIKLDTKTTPSENFNTKTFSSCILGENADKTLGFYSINCRKFTLNENIQIGNIDSLTVVCDTCSITSKSIRSIESRNDLTPVLEVYADEVSTSTFNFYGKITTKPSGMSEFALGIEFFYYSEKEISEFKCPMTSLTESSNTTCQHFLAEQKLSTKKIHAEISSNFEGDEISSFAKCTLSTQTQTALTFNFLICEETIVDLEIFTFNTCDLGDVTFNNNKDSIERIVMDSKFTSVSVSDEYTGILFYGAENTVDETGVFVVEIYEADFSRHFFGTEETPAGCTYSENGFDYDDCKHQSKYLDLMILTDGYNEEFLFKTITISSNVKTVTSLVASTLKFEKTDDLLTIETMVAYKLDLTVFRRIFVIGDDNTGIGDILGDVVPYLHSQNEINVHSSVKMVGYAILFNGEETVYRYYEIDYSQCTCDPNNPNKFIEWDCNDDLETYTGYTLVCDVESFEFKQNGRQFSSFTVSEQSCTYTYLNVDKLIITTESKNRIFNDIVSIESIDSLDGLKVLFYTNSIEQLPVVYYHELKDKFFRVSTEEALFCTFDENYSDQIRFIEYDCGLQDWHSSESILKTCDLVKIENTLEFPAITFKSIEFHEGAKTIWLYGDVRLTEYKPKNEEKLVVKTIDNLIIEDCQTYHVVATVTNYKVSGDFSVSNSIIEGTTLPTSFELPETMDDSILFVFTYTGSDSFTFSGSGEIKMHQISEKNFRISKGENQYCTYDVDADEFEEFDCSSEFMTSDESYKYMNLRFTSYGSKTEINMYSADLNKFKTVAIPKSGITLKLLEVETVKNSFENVLFDSCSVSNFLNENIEKLNIEFKTGSIGKLEVDCSTIKEWSISLESVDVDEFTLNENCNDAVTLKTNSNSEIKTLTMGTLFKQFEVYDTIIDTIDTTITEGIFAVVTEDSTIDETKLSKVSIGKKEDSTLMYRYVFGSEEQYCTIENEKYLEWDCQLGFVKDNQLPLFIKSTKVTLPDSVMKFTKLIVDESIEGNILIKFGTTPLILATYTLPTKNNLYFDGSLTIESIEEVSSLENTIKLSYVAGTLVIGNFNTDIPNYMFTAKVYEGDNSLQISDEEYRIGNVAEMNEKTCTLIGDCEFIEGDCYTVSFDDSFGFHFDESTSHLKVIGGIDDVDEITYNCANYQWGIFEPTGKSKITGSISSNKVIFDDIDKEITGVVTVYNEISFVQPSTGEITRKMSLFFAGEVSVSVSQNDQPMAPFDGENVNELDSRELLEGKIAGNIPANINGNDCSEVYYFKSTGSKCTCPLISQDLSREGENVFQEEFDDNCREINVDNVYTLELSDSTVTNIKISDDGDQAFVFSEIKVTNNDIKEISFQCADGVSKCSITFKVFAPTILVKFIGEELTVYIDAFVEGDSSSYILVDGATLSTNLESLEGFIVYIPIISTQEIVYGITGSGKFTYDGKTYHRYYKDESNTLCPSRSLTVDCKNNDFSIYYTIDCSDISQNECKIANNFKDINIKESSSPITLTSSSETIITLSEMNVNVPVIISENVLITKLWVSGKYTLFGTTGPESFEKVSGYTGDYLYNTLVSDEIEGMYEEDCSVDSNNLFRHVSSKQTTECVCAEDSMMVDCEYHKEHFNYYVKNKQTTIEDNWKTLNIDGSLVNDVTEITLKQGLTNKFVVNDCAVKFISTTSQTTIMLDFTSGKFSYIFVGDNVLVSDVEIESENEGQLLFVQTPRNDNLISTGYSFVNCVGVVRVFKGDGENVGCTCAQTNKALSNVDCEKLSVNYDLDCKDSECKVDLSWNSVTGSNTDGTKLTISKDVKTIKQGEVPLFISSTFDFTSLKVELSSSNTFFFFESSISLTNTISLSIPFEKSYYMTVNGNVYNKLSSSAMKYQHYSTKSLYRIVSSTNNIQLKCTLSNEENSFRGPTDFVEPDCQFIGDTSYPLTYSDFDIELTDKLDVEEDLGDISFNKLISKYSTALSITFNNGNGKLSFVSVDISYVLTLTGKTIEIGTMTISPNGKIIHSNDQLKITTLIMNTKLEIIESTAGELNIETMNIQTGISTDETIVVGRASHTGLSIGNDRNQPKITVVKYNERTTVNFNPSTDNYAVECYLNQNGDSFNEMFSQINCPCDTNDNCQIAVGTGVVSSISLPKKSIAQWIIPDRTELSISFDEGFAECEISSISTSSQVTLMKPTKIGSIRGSGKVIVETESDCTIGSIENSEIETTGSGVVTMTLVSLNHHIIDCKNCVLNTGAHVVISSLAFGAERTIVVSNSHDMFIENINFNEGTIIPIVFKGTKKVTLESNEFITLPSIPIRISENGDKVTVEYPEGDNNRYLVKCTPPQLFLVDAVSSFDPVIFCSEGENNEVVNADSACDNVDYCKLTIDSSASPIELKSSYDHITIESQSDVRISNFPSDMENVFFECSSSISVIIEKLNSIKSIKSDGCHINIVDSNKKDVSIYMFQNENKITSTGNVKLMTNKFSSLNIAGKLTIDRDVMVKGDLTCGSLICESGSLTVTGDITVSIELNINENFGVFEANKLTRSSGTFTTNKYLLYSIKETNGVTYSKSYLSSQNSEEKEPHKYCYTTKQNSIELANKKSYLNHENSGCGSNFVEKNYTIQTESVIVNTENTFTEIDCSLITDNAVVFKGDKKLSVNKFIGKGDIYVESSITGNDENEIITHNSGSFKNIKKLTVNTNKQIELTNCKELQLVQPALVTVHESKAKMVISIDDVNQFSSTYDYYIYVEKDITLSLTSSGSNDESFVLIKSHLPIKLDGTLPEKYFTKCNNKIICYNCENVVYSCEEEVTTVNGVSYTCLENSCVATVEATVDSIKENTEKIIVESTTQNEIEIHNIPNTVKTIEVISGNVKLYYLPTDLIVKGTSVVSVEIQSKTTKEVSIQGDNGSTITLKNPEGENGVSFKNINAGTLVAEKFKDAVVYGKMNVTSLKVIKATFDIRGNVYVAELQLAEAEDQSTLFDLNNEVDDIQIKSMETSISDVCVFILDIRKVQITPLVEKPEGVEYKDNLYFINCEEGSFEGVEKCSLSQTNIEQLYVYESSYYSPYSLCPDENKILDFSSAENMLNIYGFEEDTFADIVLPSQSSLTSSTTNQVNIQKLETQSVKFNSKFYINNLSVKEKSTLTINENVEIDSIKADSTFDVVIESGFVLTIHGDVDLTIGTLTIKGTTTSLIAKNSTLTVSKVVVDCSRSGSIALIDVKSFGISSGFNVECLQEVTDKSIQSIVETTDKMKIENNEDVSLVCSSKTLVYPNIGTERYICPTSYVCEEDDVATCESSRGDNSKQQYIYHVSADQTFEGNVNNTTPYDIVYVDSSVTITLGSGSKYLFALDQNAEPTIQCPTDGMANDCQVSILGGSATLKGHGQFFDTSSNIDIVGQLSSTANIKLVDGSLYDFYLIEGIDASVDLSGSAEMEIVEYGDYHSISTSDNAVIYVREAFDCESFKYNGGQIIVEKQGAIAGLNTITIEKNIENECSEIIKQDETMTVAEQIWDGKVDIKEKDYDVFMCSKSQLSVCPKGKSVACNKIECSETDRLTRDICYCSYDPKIGQDCAYKCESENGECSITTQMTRIPSFNSLNIPDSATLTITVPTIFYSLDVSSSLTIITEVPIYIHEIVDGNCQKTNGEKCTLTIQAKEGSEVELVVEKINIVSANSVLVIDVHKTKSRQIHVENGQFDVKTIIEIPEKDESLIPYSQPQVNEKVNELEEDIVRELVFKKCTVTFYDASGIEVYGPKYEVDFTSKNENVDATYNKLTIEQSTMDVIGSYKERDIPTVIYFDIVGTVNVKTLTGSFKAIDNTEREYLNLIQNNLPKYLTVEGLSGNVKKDEQEYALILVREGVDISKVEIDEISCALKEGNYYQFDEMSKGIWDRGTCPCDKEGCVIDVSASTTTIEYDFTNRKLDKFVATNAEIEGSAITISEIVAEGVVDLKSQDINVETLSIGKDGEIKINSKMEINSVKRDGEEIGGKVSTQGGNVKFKSFVGVDLMVGADGTVIFDADTTANFKGQTITLQKGGQIDIFSDNIDFDETTTINVKFETPKLTQPISISDSNTGGLTANIVKAKFVATIPDESGRVYPLLRFVGSGLDSVKVEIVPDGSIKRSGVSNYKVVSACNGVVITDLANDKIDCPDNPMNSAPVETTFPIWIIIIVVVAVVVLLIIVVIFVIYLVQVMLQRRANMKVFNEGEEVELDLGQNDEEKKESKESSQEGNGSGSESSSDHEEKEEKSEESKKSDKSSEKSKSDSGNDSKSSSKSKSASKSESGSGSASGSESESGSGSVSASGSD